ncbi:MAG: hypothetical protein ACD_34C00511G0001, partial [uncultured bacterium]
MLRIISIEGNSKHRTQVGWGA